MNIREIVLTTDLSRSTISPARPAADVSKARLSGGRSTRSGRADAARRCSAVHAVGRGEGALTDNEHPKGALLFILVFLALIVGFWINTYLRLWLR
jgi:hypothetical protein